MIRALPWLVAGLLGLAACGSVDAPFQDASTGCDPACDTHATCSNQQCSCDTGYMGDGLTCADVDECAANNGGCSDHALCTNTDGSRTCACLVGYIGDGLTCAPVWELVGSFPGMPLDPEGFGSKATAVGTNIYFGPEANIAANKYMRAFNTQTRQLSGPLALPPAAADDFCACGYTDVFVGDPVGGYVYMFGNYGYRYEPGTNRWLEVTTYTASVSRGEAAAAYEGNNRLIFMVGGRGPLNTALVYQVSNQAFTTEPGTLPAPLSDAAAWAPAGNNLTYVAGGDQNGRQLLVHATGTPIWTRLADAPMNIGRPHGMGDFGPRIWVASNQAIQFYNPGTDTWDRQISVPPGFEYAVSAAGQVWALAQAGGTLEVHRLVAIE